MVVCRLPIVSVNFEAKRNFCAAQVERTIRQAQRPRTRTVDLQSRLRRHGGAVFPYPQLKLPVRAMRSENRTVSFGVVEPGAQLAGRTGPANPARSETTEIIGNTN